MFHCLFFFSKVRLPISIKRLCAWLNMITVFFSFAVLAKQGTPVLSFLCVSPSLSLSSPALLLHIKRKRRLFWACLQKTV